MRILHISDGWERNNGAAQIARHIASEQEKNKGAIITLSRFPSMDEIKSSDEVWIHCGWKTCLWRALILARFYKVPVIKWMPEACYDPIRLNYHGWKKRLAGPIERFCLRRTTSLVATCEAEATWIRDYVGLECPPVEIIDVRNFFNLNLPNKDLSLNKNVDNVREDNERKENVLYLGRRHPLKGIEFLEQAIEELNKRKPHSYELRIVSDHTGAELEADWQWCDVLCLPTLSDNFGLVVAEALERGKRVIVTDGAPAWHDLASSQGIYLKGYRDGTKEERIRLLVDALS